MSNQAFNKLNDDFERFLSSLLEQTSESELTPEKRRDRRRQADASAFDFCRIYYSRIFDIPFNAVHLHIDALESGKYSVSGFPMSGKTAFTFVAKVIKPILDNIPGIINVTLRTQEAARQRTYQLYRLIVYNRLVMYDYEIDVLQEMKGYYIINKSTLLATSVETGLRNYVDDDFKRFRISVADDTYNRISAASENDNQKTTDFITGELYRQMEPDGLSIVLGNRINEDCPIVRLQEMYPQHHFSFPVRDQNGISNWPEKLSAADIAEIEAATPLDVWLGEWMDTPQEVGDIFDPGWIHPVNINLLEIVATISAIDPSSGQSPAACYKGIATISITSKLEVILEDIYLRKEGYFQIFDYIDSLRSRLPRWKVLIFENDFNQWFLAEPYYRQWQEKRSKSIPLYLQVAKDLKTTFRASDKESRILNLVHPHQTGMFLYNELIMNTGDFKLYRSQYLSFGKHGQKKLDGLDACASAYINIFRYIETGGFKSLAQRVIEKTRGAFR
jgi:hypothetical protein